MILNRLIAPLLLGLLCVGCHQNVHILEPAVFYVPQDRHIRSLPEAFPPLATHELRTEWGRELRIGNSLAKELDLYRAITAFKRALILIPPFEKERRNQIEYSMVVCYYLANHYQDVVEVFEMGDLIHVPSTFPGFSNLLLVLYDSYNRIGECDKAHAFLEILREYDPKIAEKAELGTAITSGQLGAIYRISEEYPEGEEVRQFLDCYCYTAKSVRQAQTLNAILPGAGYFYVGQKKSALTSLALNALFTAAAIHFFDQGNIAAGIITLSFEAGWYFGGINGAGLAAKAYNETLYNNSAKELMIRQHLFPILMFKQVF